MDYVTHGDHLLYIWNLGITRLWAVRWQWYSFWGVIIQQIYAKFRPETPYRVDCLRSRLCHFCKSVFEARSGQEWFFAIAFGIQLRQYITTDAPSRNILFSEDSTSNCDEKLSRGSFGWGGKDNIFWMDWRVSMENVELAISDHQSKGSLRVYAGKTSNALNTEWRWPKFMWGLVTFNDELRVTTVSTIF